MPSSQAVWEEMIASPKFQALPIDNRRDAVRGYMNEFVESSSKYQALPIEHKAKVMEGLDSEAGIPTFKPRIEKSTAIGGYTDTWEQPSLLDKAGKTITSAKDIVKEKVIKPIQEAYTQPLEKPKTIGEFFYKTIPSSFAQTAYGVASFPIQVTDELTKPIVDNVIKRIKGEHKDTGEMWKAITNDMLETGAKTVEGFEKFNLEPVGVSGWQAMKDRWMSDPVGSGLGIIPLFGGIKAIASLRSVPKTETAKVVLEGAKPPTSAPPSKEELGAIVKEVTEKANETKEPISTVIAKELENGVRFHYHGEGEPTARVFTEEQKAENLKTISQERLQGALYKAAMRVDLTPEDIAIVKRYRKATEPYSSEQIRDIREAGNKAVENLYKSIPDKEIANKYVDDIRIKAEQTKANEIDESKAPNITITPKDAWLEGAIKDTYGMSLSDFKSLITKETPEFKEGARVKLGKSPQIGEIIRELEQTPTEKELGERIFEVKNIKTGEIENYPIQDLKLIKEKIRKVEELTNKVAQQQEIINKSIAQNKLEKAVLNSALKEYAKEKGIDITNKNRKQIFGELVKQAKQEPILSPAEMRPLKMAVGQRIEATTNAPAYGMNLGDKGVIAKVTPKGYEVNWDKGGGSKELYAGIKPLEEMPQGESLGAKKVGVEGETPSHLTQLKESVEGTFSKEGAEIKNAYGKVAESKPAIGDFEVEKGKIDAETAEAKRNVESIPIKKALDGLSGLRKVYQGTKEIFTKIPNETVFGRILGSYQYARAKYNLETKKFAQAMKANVPEAKRVAISNWIQAKGNIGLLKERASKMLENTKFSLKEREKLSKGYMDATELTSDEKILAQNIRNYYDAMLKDAIEYEWLEKGIEDYVNQMWDVNSGFKKKILSVFNGGALRRNPAFLRERKFDDYFEGEQLGYRPRNKDIAFLVSHYNVAFNEAAAAREFVRTLLRGKIEDTIDDKKVLRPLAIVEGVGDETGKFYDSTARGKDYGDYREVPHPAMREWKWKRTDAEGNSEFVKNNIAVHPFIYKQMNALLGRSRIKDLEFRGVRVGAMALRVSGEVKGTLLSALVLPNPFHQIQLGIHALEHRVSPFNPAVFDIDDPIVKQGIENGLVVVPDYYGLSEFQEGVSSAGLIHKLPGVGRVLQKYSDYLFHDYIPRLKVAMYREAFERNTGRYKDRMSSDQIAEITANQANAAFGMQNYVRMGRSKTFQDTLRLMALAPDFLEARVRFTAQAVKVGGREQQVALLVGALGQYIIARVANQIINNDPLWEARYTFGIKIGKHIYGIRSVQGDDMHAFTDPFGFMYWRLNPATVGAVEKLLNPRNIYGTKVNAIDRVEDIFGGAVPIPLQGLYQKIVHAKDVNWEKSVLQPFGISERQYKTPAEQEIVNIRTTQAYQPPTNPQHNKLLRNLRDKWAKGDEDFVKKVFKNKEITVKDLEYIMTPALTKSIESMSLDNAMKVWNKAYPEEKKLLAPLMITKAKNQYYNALEKERPAILEKLKLITSEIKKLK